MEKNKFYTLEVKIEGDKLAIHSDGDLNSLLIIGLLEIEKQKWVDKVTHSMNNEDTEPKVEILDEE